MSKSSKSNVLFILFLATLILISIFITYLLITNHNNKINNPVNTNKPYYSFQAVSKKDPIDAFAKYPVNPITIDISDKVSISGLKNKEVETKINNKLAKLDSSKNEYGYNFCNVTFNYSNVLGIDCKNEYVMVNLIDGEDIILEEIFQKDSDLFEIIKEALYSSYCAWGTCANREELYEYDSYIDNYLITAIKEIKNREYKICLTNTSLYIYLNYYENVVNSEDDGKPIGIILCAEKDNVMLEYALGGLSNNIFASTYTYYIPNKEQLISEVEKVLESNE